MECVGEAEQTTKALNCRNSVKNLGGWPEHTWHPPVCTASAGNTEPWEGWTGRRKNAHTRDSAAERANGERQLFLRSWKARFKDAEWKRARTGEKGRTSFRERHMRSANRTTRERETIRQTARKTALRNPTSECRFTTQRWHDTWRTSTVNFLRVEL